MPDELVTPTPAEGAAPVAPGADSPDSVQQRIDELFGGKKAAEEAATELRNQNVALQAELLRLKEQQAALSTKSTAPDPLAALVADTSKGETDALKAVMAEIKSLRSQQEQDRIAAQLRQAQEASFAKAASSMPDLVRSGSPLAKATAQVYSSDPVFRNHPNGPLLAAHLAASLVQSLPPTATPEQKRAAGGGPSIGPVSQPAASATELANLEARLTEVQKRLRDGGTAQAAYPEYTKLRMEIANLKAKLKGA